ncbi:MAG TPA: PA0069 family radical SAM protein [Polyangiaceae bacterium]|nr:PA0069 family radical SAM protein [Polyangiaceae bacterium]
MTNHPFSVSQSTVKLIPVSNPPNPFDRQRLDSSADYLGDWSPEAGDGDEPPERGGPDRGQALRVFEDHSRSILSKNDSPDLAMRFSVNPYRGCYHGCAYCYARPTHEYLGFGAGTDFERVIVIKPLAAELLREALRKKSWQHEMIVFSGVTDCYQPLEAHYQLTRQCLQVCVEEKNPVGIITKSALIERDIDLLVELNRVAGASVTISIPFADDKMARKIEPYATPPSRRFKIVERLSAAGLSVGVNVAPVIPGLSDSQIPEIVERAAAAGAKRLGMILVRLPGSVRPVFQERITQHFPLAVSKILARTREVRGGKLNDPNFGTRMSGAGEYASSIERLMQVSAARFGLSYGTMTDALKSGGEAELADVYATGAAGLKRATSRPELKPARKHRDDTGQLELIFR